MRVAHALELALLQGAEQLHLQVGRGGVDFVEEDRAGVGRFEAAGAVVDRAGECAADVAEELAFEQAFAERAAVDADERPVAALAELVDRVGDELLAGAGFAEQQHRRAAAGDLARERGRPPSSPRLEPMMPGSGSTRRSRAVLERCGSWPAGRESSEAGLRRAGTCRGRERKTGSLAVRRMV